MAFVLVYFLVTLLLVTAISGRQLRTDQEVLDSFGKENYLQQGDMFIRHSPQNEEERMDWDVYNNWPDNTVPYVVSENVTKDLRPVIKVSIDYLEKYTCVKFRPVEDSDEFWVRFMMHPSLVNNPNSAMMCAAIVSFQGTPDQGVYLGPRCNPPAMVHELMHTIGLYHEHNRNDRDQFITVHPQNMTEEARGQYITDKEWCKMQGIHPKYCTMNDYGLNYNYDSLMHYCQLCGSIDGRSHVYTLLNNKKALGNPKNVGQAYGLSEGDWLLINKKYGCDPKDNPQIPKPPPIPENPPKFGKPDADLSGTSIKAEKGSCKRKLAK